MSQESEQRLMGHARSQFGVVTWTQCRESGLSRHWTRQRLVSGAWVEINPRVFKLGPGPASQDTLDDAALLACGPDSALSHFSAARRWGLDLGRQSVIHVSIPASRHHGMAHP